MSYFVYVLLCRGNTYYTGITTDLRRRFAEHQSGLGAKYTRSFHPVKIAYMEVFPDRATAQIREAAIKKLSHSQKAKLAGA